MRFLTNLAVSDSIICSRVARGFTSDVIRASPHLQRPVARTLSCIRLIPCSPLVYWYEKLNEAPTCPGPMPKRMFRTPPALNNFRSSAVIVRTEPTISATPPDANVAHPAGTSSCCPPRAPAASKSITAPAMHSVAPARPVTRPNAIFVGRGFGSRSGGTWDAKTSPPATTAPPTPSVTADGITRSVSPPGCNVACRYR